MGHEWEDMDVACFLSTTHVFVISVEHLLHLIHSSQCRGHSSEQDNGSAPVMELVCYWGTVDAQQTPIFLLALLTKEERSPLKGWRGSSQI